MENEPRVIDDVKLVLNYEQLLSRAIDRCLYYRCKTEHNSLYYVNAVKALISSMVDMPGKPIHTEMMNRYKEIEKAQEPHAYIDRFTLIFEEACKLLAKYRVLFRGSSYEVGTPIESDKKE